MNEDVRTMLRHPGRYAVSDGAFRLHGRYVMVEVDDAGTVHQLTPDGARNGTLDGYGWKAGTRVFVTDPAERVFVRIGKIPE